MQQNNKLSMEKKLLDKNTIINISSWNEDNGVEIFSDDLVPGMTLSLEINYPLSVPSSINIEVTEDTSVSTIISRIADKYRRIYKNPKEYGIWGHGLGDLWIEGLTLDTDAKKINLYVGS